jgi:prepilin-type N-terminal cleavage/methylation domain-containing protein
MSADNSKMSADNSPEADEAGFTLVELMVAAAAMLILMAAFAGFMLMMMSTASSTVKQDNSTSSVRVAMLQLQHDIQAANPLMTLSSVGDYSDTLKLEMDTPSGNVETVTWSYNSTSGTLYRTVSASSGSGSSLPEVTGLINGSSSNPVFSYYDDQGNNLVASGTSSTTEVAVCTARVAISLEISGGPKTFPYTERLNVALPDNLQPGRSQCA